MCVQSLFYLEGIGPLIRAKRPLLGAKKWNNYKEITAQGKELKEELMINLFIS